MCFRHSSYFVKGIVIAIWTIVQTSFHILFLLGGFYICQIKPSHYLLIIFYITYFYNYEKCGNFSVRAEEYFLQNNSKPMDLPMNATIDEDDVHKIVHTIMERAIFPRESSSYSRTHFYFSLYIIYDGCWLISSFLLFAGVTFQVKKYLSLLFYGPWLLLTGASVILDVVIAVHFGLDMLQIYNYSTWLKFIGVINYQDFVEFNTFQSSKYIPHLSSIIICVFFSRFLVFWVVNIIHFFKMGSTFTIALRGSDGPNKILNSIERGAQNRKLNTINSSESRIRNWQLFYGTVETNSTRSSDSMRSEKDYNSPRGENLKMTTQRRRDSWDSAKPVAGNSTTRYSIDSNIEYLSSTNSSPKTVSTYLKFPDVVDSMENNNKIRKGSTDSIRRQKPWSYLRFNETPPSVLGHFKEKQPKDQLIQSTDDRAGRPDSATTKACRIQRNPDCRPDNHQKSFACAVRNTKIKFWTK